MSTNPFNPPAPDVGEKIPAELKALARWLFWKAERDEKSGKVSKVPYYVDGTRRSGSLGSKADLQCLATLDIALAVYSRDPTRWAGIGFALIEGDGVGALDLDDVDPEGAEVARVMQAVKGCYIETSPSGKGRRVLGSTGGFTQVVTRGFEAYSKGRYVTVTGHVLDGRGREWASIDDGVSVIAQIANSRDNKKRDGAEQLSASLETEGDPDRAKSALGWLDPGCEYQRWIAILMALKSTRWERAEELAREWSAGCHNKYSPEAFDKAWRSIKAEGGITIKTLYYRARMNGWTPPATEEKAKAEKNAGDIRLGQEFADLHRGRLFRAAEGGDVYAFAEATGWQRCPNADDAALKAAQDTVAAMWRRVTEYKDKGEDEDAELLTKLAGPASQMARLQAMARLGWTHDGMTTPTAELDADEGLLGVRGGVLDLEKRELRPFSPDDRTTKRAGVTFDPAAGAPVFNQFLERVQPDGGVRRLLGQIAGLCLWGKPGEQRLFFFHGGGANGKSTFVEALCFVLGEYAITLQAESLMRQDRSSQGPSPDVVRLRGVRGAFASEVRDGRLDEERVKYWTGGDKLIGRAVYAREAIEFDPSHTLVMTGNSQPAIHDASDGIWRRMTLIEWGERIPEADQDKELANKLRAEGSGILNWALDGLADWRSGGLQVPASVQADTARYRSTEDILGQFLEECCVVQPDAVCSRGDLYNRYQAWATAAGMKAANQNTLTRRLADRGVQVTPSKREYIGLELKGLSAAE